MINDLRVFKELFQFATVGILVVNRSGEIELINPHAEALFGYEEGELYKKRLEVLIPSASRDRHKGLREGYMADPRNRPMGKGLTLHAVRKDGTEFPVEISLSHYLIEEDMIAVAFISDITVRAQVEEELRQLNIQLEEKVLQRTEELEIALEQATEINEMKSAFIAMASHEFRTPLTAIMTSTSLIEKLVEKDMLDRLPKHFERIKDSIDRITRILDDFLFIEQADEGKMVVQRKEFDLVELVNSCIDELYFVKKDGQEIHYEHLGTGQIRMDKSMLHNVIVNLISNALKYSEKPVQVISQINGTVLKIRVTDEGRGIPESEQKNVFEKFFRASNIDNTKGTGLGLNIVRKYVELMNGNINLQSKENEGTSVEIDFPLEVA